MWDVNHRFKDFEKFFVGFDKLSDKLTTLASQSAELAQKYPPYNIKKVDDNRYVIEMAVAGFGRHDLELELDGGKLIVRGKTETDKDAEGYLYRGIGHRAFTRYFTLADNVEIQNADLINGMLKIWLEAIIPEHKKPKKIEISGESLPEKQLLTESK